MTQTLEVSLDANRVQYPFVRHAIPFHTDHPSIRSVAWYCFEQDKDGGATAVLNGYEIVRSLSPADRQLLRSVSVPVLRSENEQPLVSVGANNRPHIYWLPEFIKAARPRMSYKQSRAVDRFADLLQDAEEARSHHLVRLHRGECLFVDNQRMLHGRSALGSASRRHLRRAYNQCAW